MSNVDSDDEVEGGDSSAISDAKKEMLDFEEQEWNHDIAFRVSAACPIHFSS